MRLEKHRHNNISKHNQNISIMEQLLIQKYLKNVSDLIPEISNARKEVWRLDVSMKPMIELLFLALHLFISVAQKQLLSGVT